MDLSQYDAVTTINGHTYALMRHRWEEGLTISAELLGIMSGPLSSVVQSVFASSDIQSQIKQAIADIASGEADQGDVQAELQDSFTELLSALAEADWSGAGQKLGEYLVSGRFPGLARKLLIHTMYIDDDGRPHPLGKGGGMSETLFRGNYAELYQVLYWIERQNSFFPVPTSSSAS